MNCQRDAREAMLARFFDEYGTAERADSLWSEWTASLDDNARTLLETLIADAAETEGVSLEAARRRFALEKLVADRGVRWAQSWLETQDRAALLAGRTLKPMTLKKRR